MDIAQEDIEKKLAEVIIKSIENSIKALFASLEGADSRYYYKLFRSIEEECEKIAEISGLSIEVVKKLAGLIGKEVAAGIAKELVISDFQYDKEKDSKKFTNKDVKNDKFRFSEEERDRKKEDIEELDEENLKKEDEIDSEMLAKLDSFKQKKQTKKALKDLLFSMIAHRMDPKRRAGETAGSNVKYATLYGRGNQLTIAQLVEAGVITSAVLNSLESSGIKKGSHFSLENVRNIIKESVNSILDLIRNSGYVESGTTKIPKQEEGISILGNLSKSLDILSEKADSLSKENVQNLTPEVTPHVQMGDSGKSR